MGSAMEVDYLQDFSNTEHRNNFDTDKPMNITTVGFGDITLFDVLGSDGYIETKYPNAQILISNLSKISSELCPQAILCCNSLTDDDIKRIVDYASHSDLLIFTPIGLLIKQSNAKNRTDVFKLGLDDVFDESTIPELFYERIDLIHKTKRRLIEDPDDKLILTVAKFGINVNVFKRIGDILISSFMLLALSPLFIVIAILIKLESKGSVFYTAKRAGGGYKIFNFYKFRSMAQGSDEEMSKVLHLNQYDAGNSDSKSVFYKIKSDPRVTKIGSFIRKTSIDELPQLINVLKGDMSLVGNRPLPLYEAQQLTRDNWVARFNAPAGITGLWQISKRGKADMSEEERVQLDVEYSQKHSFWYDLWILVRTVPAIFQEDDV